MSKKNRLVLLFTGYIFLAFPSSWQSLSTKFRQPFTTLYHYINGDKIIADNTIELLTQKIKYHENLLKELPQSDLASDEKMTLQEKYTKEIKHLSDKIEQEKNKIQLAEYNNKNWLIKAVSLGAAIGLGAVFAYKLLTMPRLSMPINENIHQSTLEPPIPTYNETTQEELYSDPSSFGINTRETNTIDPNPSLLNPPATTIPSQKTELSQEQLKQKKLYESRSKNYTNTATIAFLNVAFGWAIWGPMHLPIDVVLLALSLASGAEAWQYKQKAGQLSQYLKNSLN